MGLRYAGPSAAPRICRSANDVLGVLDRADEAVWLNQSLVVAAESGLLARLDRPATLAELAHLTGLPEAVVRALVEVLTGFGLVTLSGQDVIASSPFRAFTGEAGSETFAAALKAPNLQTADFRRRAHLRDLSLDGWTHDDPAIIEAQGILTRLWAKAAIGRLRYLPGLSSRLTKGAALLDVGAGAAGLSIALCQAFPHLTAVAMEPANAPAAIAEAQVARANLSERIAIRRQNVEQIGDTSAFDLVFLPQMFLSDTIIEQALSRVYGAMKPGAWMLVPVLARSGGDASSAIARLKNLLWGGNMRGIDLMTMKLAACGFSPVIRAPGRQAFRMICARKPGRGTLK